MNKIDKQKLKAHCRVLKCKNISRSFTQIAEYSGNKSVDLVHTLVGAHPLNVVGFFPSPLDSSDNSRPFNGSKAQSVSGKMLF
jgi:hypothetical protein